MSPFLLFGSPARGGHDRVLERAVDAFEARSAEGVEGLVLRRTQGGGLALDGDQQVAFPHGRVEIRTALLTGRGDADVVDPEADFTGHRRGTAEQQLLAQRGVQRAGLGVRRFGATDAGGLRWFHLRGFCVCWLCLCRLCRLGETTGREQQRCGERHGQENDALTAGDDGRREHGDPSGD